jgi:hypothetical protein
MNLMCTVRCEVSIHRLFFSFDYGDFKIFGSSEAQIIVKDQAEIHL